MNKGLLTPRRLLLIVAVLLLVNSLLGRRYAEAVGRPLANVADAALMPVTLILRSFSNTLRQPPGPRRYDNDMQLDVVIADRDGLSAMVKNLEAEVRSLKEENARLRNAHELFSYDRVSIVEARVQSFNGSTKNPILTINRGQSSGIQPRMSVEWQGNLVGVIESAGRRTARVRLITSHGAQFRVLIRPAASDVPPYEINEIVKLGPDRQSFYVDVNSNGPGFVGDFAHLADESERYPFHSQGRIVGRVVAVDRVPQQPLLKRLVIRPTLPLTRLSRVDVLVPVADEQEAAP